MIKGNKDILVTVCFQDKGWLLLFISVEIHRNPWFVIWSMQYLTFNSPGMIIKVPISFYYLPKGYAICKLV